MIQSTTNNLSKFVSWGEPWPFRPHSGCAPGLQSLTVILISEWMDNVGGNSRYESKWV